MNSKGFTLLLMLFLCGLLKAQTIDSRIQEVYGDKTQELVTNDPDRLKFLNDILTNRFEVKETAFSNSEDKYPKLSNVALLNKYNSQLIRDIEFNPISFNPLKYQLDFYQTDMQMIYRIDNTNYVLIIYPQTIK